MQRVINEAATAWGLQCMRYEIRELPSLSMGLFVKSLDGITLPYVGGVLANLVFA